MRAVIDSSRRIYEAHNDHLEKPGGSRRAGAPVQGAGRQDAAAHPRAPRKQRGLRLSHPRQPGRSAADGLAASCLSAQERARRGAARWRLDALPGVAIAQSCPSGRRGCRGDALQQLPATNQDRKQFQRSFGQLYVLDSPAGGACCAPRAQESAMMTRPCSSRASTMQAGRRWRRRGSTCCPIRPGRERSPPARIQVRASTLRWLRR